MRPVDIITAAVVILILLTAGLLILRAKKKGKKCIGCPESGCETCPGCRGTK